MPESIQWRLEKIDEKLDESFEKRDLEMYLSLLEEKKELVIALMTTQDDKDIS